MRERVDKEHVGLMLKPFLVASVILSVDGHHPPPPGQRIVAGVYHLQNVNPYDSRLKE